MTSRQNIDMTGGTRPSSRRLVTYGKAPHRRPEADSARSTATAIRRSDPSTGHLKRQQSQPSSIQAARREQEKPILDTYNGSTMKAEKRDQTREEHQAMHKRSHAQAFVASEGTEDYHQQRKEDHGIAHSVPWRQMPDNSQQFAKSRITQQSNIHLVTQSNSLSTNVSHKRPVIALSRSPSPNFNLDERQPSFRPNDAPDLARRPRIIDKLVTQRTDSPDTDSSNSDIETSRKGSTQVGELVAMQTPKPSFGRDAHSAQRPGETSTRKKVKFTYSQARNFRHSPQERETLGGTHPVTESEPLLSDALGLSSPAAFDFDEDSEEGREEGSKVAIKSVHELRRAGANNRFADEMEDLLSRIGQPRKVPSNARRNALFDLIQKLQQPEFVSQFRDHATRDQVIRRIGDEKDLIAGFALTAIVGMFLSTGSAPHLLFQLVEDGVGRLLSRLLKIKLDIELVAGDREQRMTHSTRKALQSAIKALKLQKFWHGLRPKTLSPRRMALQFLDTFVHSADAKSIAIVTREADEGLFSVAHGFLNTDVDEDIDFMLLISTLEAQSSLTTSQDDAILDMRRWSLPVSACLERVLQQWPNHEAKLEATMIRLAINTTNANGGAAAFDRPNLLLLLAKCICKGFSEVQVSLADGHLDGDVYERLLLVLGVGINIFEHSPAARGSMDEMSQINLVKLYSDNYQSMDEADSEEKSKLSVGFGYLAVLLGYLCLSVDMRKLIESSGHGLRNLIKVIQQFITVLKHVGKKSYELETLVTDLRAGSWTS